MIFRITFDFEKAAATGEVVSLPPVGDADVDDDDFIVVVAILETDDKKSHKQRQKQSISESITMDV